MTRLVHCRKYRKELEGLPTPPMPGPKGRDIYENISQQAWQEWQQLQTMLINEKHLSLIDPRSREYLTEQMDKFFANADYDKAEGYIPAP
ncbi:MAG: oxidative damage protection protein [Gammaproteobacteria bacterium]|nr:MAG: oxidative damage protection protein [Gammaproteobacteria bacterium]